MFTGWIEKILIQLLLAIAKWVGAEIVEHQENRISINIAGVKARRASEEAINDLLTPEGENEPNPEQTPTVSKWSDFFRHRRSRRKL